MMCIRIVVLMVVCGATLLCPAVDSASSTVAWCYDKPTCNPTTWPQIATQFCNGSQQSPIDIVSANVQANPNLTSFNFTGFNNNSTLLSITNSGESVVVTLDGDQMKVSGGDLPGLYTTEQFHFHWGNGSTSPGSEHSVDGQKYLMELHIVNVNSKYNRSIKAAMAANDSAGLAVLGFFIEGTNGSNSASGWKTLTSFLSSIPSYGNSTTDIMNKIAMDSVLEGVNRTKYYRYRGSLTTPTCNEIVAWTIFKEPIKVSYNLINLFSNTVFFKSASTSVLTSNNFRGVQALNGRVVTSQVAGSASSASAASTAAMLLAITLLYLSSFC